MSCFSFLLRILSILQNIAEYQWRYDGSIGFYDVFWCIDI